MQLRTLFFTLLFSVVPSVHALFAEDAIGIEFVPPNAVLGVVVKPEAVSTRPLLEMVPWEVMSVKSKEFTGVTLQDVQSVLSFTTAPGPDGKPLAGAVVRLAKGAPLESLFPALREDGQLELAAWPESNKPYLKGTNGFLLDVYPVNENIYLLGTPETVKAMVSQQAKPVAGPLAALLQSDLQDAEFQALLVVEPIRDMARFLLADPRFDMFPGMKELPEQLSHAQLICNLDMEKGGVTLKLAAPNEANAMQLEETVEGLLETVTKLARQMAQPANPDSPEGQAFLQYTDRISHTLLAALKPVRTKDQVVMTTVGKPGTSPQVLLASGTALFMPMIANLQASNVRSRSANNLKQIMLAMWNYYDTYQKMPADSYGADGKPLLSWRVHILPYIEQQALYNQFHLDEPWNSEHNQKLIKQMPMPYATSADHKLAAEGRTRYERPLGKGLPASKEGDLKVQDITDGTSNTFAVVEVPEADAVIWTKPADIEIDVDAPMKSLLPGDIQGFMAARYDGSVRYCLKNELTNDILKALLTYAGGEAVNY
ncbi:DUF1559 domain-containing protein [bacterium]|nr:DUF1559 domain-containing protein [bacterium]